MTDVDNPHPLSNINRDNARARLKAEHCPLCGTVGEFSLFEKAMHVGVRCDACGQEHIFRTRGLMWVPRAANAWTRAGKDIARAIREAGND